MSPKIAIDAEKIKAFCEKWKVRRLSLFGSVLREDFTAESDVDVLVEFEEGTHIGYFGLGAMELELTEILGRKADLRTPAELSRYFRQQVIEGASVQYAS